MSIILNLPPELEKELADEAARLNLPLPEYALRVLSTGRGADNAPKTGADLVAYWQSEGIIGSRSDITDSQTHARDLRRAAETRARS